MVKLMLENTSFIKKPGTMIIIWVLVYIYVVQKINMAWTYSEEDACKKEKFWIAHYKALGKAEYNETAGEVGKKYKGKHWRLVNGKREWYE